jgi:hypothetical protein
MTTIGTRALMDDIERDVRNRLRRHILKRGGAPEYEDEALFERVRATLTRCCCPSCSTATSSGSCRPTCG